MPQCFCLKNKDAKVLQNTVHDVCRLLWKVFFKPIQRMEAHVQNIFDGILLDNIRRRTLWRIRRKTVYDFCCQVVCSCSLPRYGLVWPQSRVIIVGTHSAESVDQSVNLVTYVYDIIWVLYFAGCVRCIYNLLWYFNMRMFFLKLMKKQVAQCPASKAFLERSRSKPMLTSWSTAGFPAGLQVGRIFKSKFQRTLNFQILCHMSTSCCLSHFDFSVLHSQTPWGSINNTQQHIRFSPFGFVDTVKKITSHALKTRMHP